MSKRGAKSGKGDSHIPARSQLSPMSQEDAQLWQAVAKTVEPLSSRSFAEALDQIEAATPHSATRLIPSAIPDGPPPNITQQSHPASRAQVKTKNGRPLRPLGSGTEPKIQVRYAPAVQPIDRKTKAKIARGRIQIQARIDLHGMTQDHAHNALLGFLARASKNDHRVVLVITGKGGHAGEFGILRQSVPRWLAEPQFRVFVNGVEEAAANHGGAGALYVRLKRRA